MYLCAREKAAGRSLTGLRDYAEATKGQICHWFTVDDLNHLKRGGRISAATALMGTMLSIKPVLHVDDEGRLISVSKARGRKASLMALVYRMEATALDAANGTVFISPGDCEGDALLVADEITRRFGCLLYTSAKWFGSHAEFSTKETNHVNHHHQKTVPRLPQV